MIKFKYTPLWDLEGTEDWLLQMFRSGFKLTRVIGPFFFFRADKKYMNKICYVQRLLKGHEGESPSLYWTETSIVVPSVGLFYYTITKYSATMEKKIKQFTALQKPLLKKVLYIHIVCMFMVLIWVLMQTIAVFKSFPGTVIAALLALSYLIWCIYGVTKINRKQ